jgi:hypothetical protein
MPKARLCPKNNMTYHVFEETLDGYRLVKSYERESTMKRSMKPNQPRWIIWTRRVTLENFSSIGAPNGYRFDGYDFVTETMPVRPLILT